MIRAVLDTNVYVSALVFGGKPAALIRLAEVGAFQVVVSEDIRQELIETLTSKFNWPKLQAHRACRELWRESHWGIPPESIRAGRDPDDDVILACAVASKATVIVTGDHDLLSLHPFRGIAILPPAAFMARLLGGSAGP